MVAEHINSRSEESPLTERFSLDEVINGLARDLQAVRDGRMSVDAARVNAELAKQLFNGIRIIVTAQRVLEGQVKTLPDGTDAKIGAA